jgi:hypothetical protein
MALQTSTGYVRFAISTALRSAPCWLTYAYIGRHCAYLWVCIFALLGLNALNIAYYFVSFEYLTYYSAVLVASGLLFTLIHAIRKNRKTNYVFRE